MKYKVLVLEKTVSKITIKLGYLESELREIKKENGAKEKMGDKLKESKKTDDVMERKEKILLKKL